MICGRSKVAVEAKDSTKAIRHRHNMLTVVRKEKNSGHSHNLRGCRWRLYDKMTRGLGGRRHAFNSMTRPVLMRHILLKSKDAEP